MTLDEAIKDVTTRIAAIAPDAVIRVMRASAEEARVRVYTNPDLEAAIKAATNDETMQLLLHEGLDVQVMVYDISTSLPPEG